MQKIFLISGIVFLALASCKKTNRCYSPSTSAPQLEINSLQHFLDSTSVVAVKDSRGFFYKISDSGSTVKPTQCNTITVDYSGRLTNGTVFDRSSQITSFPLGSLVLGWQEGLPQIGSGGKITLYIPPTLGYGDDSTHASIPANSILIFDITLVGFY